MEIVRVERTEREGEGEGEGRRGGRWCGEEER
jgi:hypothetical protein